MPAITLGMLEAAGVSFGGAFVGGLLVGDPLITAAEVGAAAFLGILGYGGLSSHVAPSGSAASGTTVPAAKSP